MTAALSDPTTLSTAEVLVRVVIAIALGALIGFERELGAQPAGLRTHVLVSLGAALFTLAGFVHTPGADPTRVAAQVATGVGFLGAGAILRDAGRIKGLTTAGSLWVTAAIGLAVGIGAYAAAVASAVAALLVLYVVKRLEHGLFPRVRGRQITLFVRPGVPVAQALNTVRGTIHVVDVSRVSTMDDGGTALGIRVPKVQSDDIAALAERLMLLDEVAGIEIRA